MEKLRLIGLKLSKETSNMNSQSSKDCGELWQKFEQEAIKNVIPNKLSDSIYAVYFDYSHDQHNNKVLSYFIGCNVEEGTDIPNGLVELNIPVQKYHIELATGKMTDCISEAWFRIENSTIDRKYGFDFELYDERSQDWNNAAVEIYISINE